MMLQQPGERFGRAAFAIECGQRPIHLMHRPIAAGGLAAYAWPGANALFDHVVARTGAHISSHAHLAVTVARIVEPRFDPQWSVPCEGVDAGVDADGSDAVQQPPPAER